MGLKSLTKLFITWLRGVHMTQVKTLAVLVWGLLRSPRLGVAALGRALPGDTAENDRFLGNGRLCVVQLVRPGLTAIDCTDLHDGKHQALVAGVVTGSRAIPIWWRVVSKAELTANQNRIEDQFAKDVRRLLPRECEVAPWANGREYGDPSIWRAGFHVL